MRTRLAPFLDLLDARYLPLLFAVAPQAYTVYAWLLLGGAPAWVAVMGGVGYEFVYVGAIAWAERGAGWSAARLPAVTALVFSVAVAVAHYGPSQGAMAVLHAGFPLVAYAYTVMMHTPARRSMSADQADQLVQEVRTLEAALEDAMARADRASAELEALRARPIPVSHPALEAGPELVQIGPRVVTLRALADHLDIPRTTLSRKLAQMQEEADHAG